MKRTSDFFFFLFLFLFLFKRRRVFKVRCERTDRHAQTLAGGDFVPQVQRESRRVLVRHRGVGDVQPRRALQLPQRRAGRPGGRVWFHSFYFIQFIQPLTPPELHAAPPTPPPRSSLVVCLKRKAPLATDD